MTKNIYSLEAWLRGNVTFFDAQHYEQDLISCSAELSMKKFYNLRACFFFSHIFMLFLAQPNL